MVHEFRPRQGRENAGTVLVLHGWRSRTEYMKAADRGLSRRRFSRHVARPARAWRLAGRRLNLASAVRAAHVAGEWFGPFAAVVGHSFGGAVAVNAVAGSIVGIPPLAASKLVLIAAPSSMPDLFRDFGRYLNLGPRTQSAIAEQVRRIAGRPLDEFIGSRQLAETPRADAGHPCARRPRGCRRSCRAFRARRRSCPAALGAGAWPSPYPVRPGDRGGRAWLRRPPGRDGSLERCAVCRRSFRSASRRHGCIRLITKTAPSRCRSVAIHMGRWSNGHEQEIRPHRSGTRPVAQA